MGFYESDRIRSKNRVQNAAYDEYQAMKSAGLTDDEIIIAAQFPKSESDKAFRNDIFSTILKIVERNRGEKA